MTILDLGLGLGVSYCYTLSYSYLTLWLLKDWSQYTTASHKYQFLIRKDFWLIFQKLLTELIKYLASAASEAISVISEPNHNTLSHLQTQLISFLLIIQCAHAESSLSFSSDFVQTFISNSFSFSADEILFISLRWMSDFLTVFTHVDYAFLSVFMISFIFNNHVIQNLSSEMHNLSSYATESDSCCLVL